MNLIKLKGFCKARDNFIQEKKKQATEWEVFLSTICDREVISKIYKELESHISIKQIIQLKTGTDLNRGSLGVNSIGLETFNKFHHPGEIITVCK